MLYEARKATERARFLRIPRCARTRSHWRRAILISLSRRVVRFDWLGNAPTREQIVYCFILAGEREPQGSHGEIQFAVTRLARFVGRQQTL